MSPRDLLLAFVPPLCWGAGFTIAKPAVEHFPPLFMMFLIYGAIVLVLLFTVKTPIRTPWKLLIPIAALAVPIQGAFVFMALERLDATTSTLLIQSQVPLAVLCGWLIAGEDLSWRKALGTLIALAGVFIVIGMPHEPPPLLPVIFMIAGALIWAVAQVLIRKYGRDDGIVQFKGIAIAGLPQLLIATLLLDTGQVASVHTATAGDWLALIFVTVVGFYIAYAVWFALLRRCRVDDLAPFTLLMPVIGILTAGAILGETILISHVAGGLVILIGLAVVTGLQPPSLKAA
jgi:O-acetylserine/cysteine efflux transporter